VRKRKGFTMVELMVVIIIMAILGLAIMPALMGSSEKAKYSRAWSDLDAIANAFTAYYGRTGDLPTVTGATSGKSLNGSFIANTTEKDLLQSFLGTPLDKLKDPWGNEYQVATNWNAIPGKGYVIVYVKGDGTVSFEGVDTSITAKTDPYNDDKTMAKLVINVM